MNTMTYFNSDSLSIIDNTSMSVNSSNSIFVILNAAFHANPGAERKGAVTRL